MALTSPAASLLTGGINAGLSVIDSLIRAGQTRKARELLQNMNIPDASKFYLDAKLMEAARMGDPEVFTAAVQGPSAMEGISTDPRLASAQMKEISGLEEITDSGSSPQMTADLLRTQGQLGTQMRGSREAALQNLASRGMLGSGMEAAMRTGIQQQGIQSASQAGADIASQQAQRRMQALQGLGSASTRNIGQQFGQSATKASAADEIAARNIGARNQGQQFNIQNKMAQNQFNAQMAMEQAKAKRDAELAAAQMQQDQAKALAGTYGG